MVPALPFNNLAERHPGVTQALGASYTEAACVCLDRHHTSPADFSIEVSNAATVALAQWQVTDARTRGAWANETDATANGAYAIAIAAIELAQGMVAIQRAETLTGADYYIAPVDESAEDLESWLRLEVSGIDRGTDAMIRQRLGEKVAQALRGASNLPAFAAVVGFRERLVAITRAVAP